MLPWLAGALGAGTALGLEAARGRWLTAALLLGGLVLLARCLARRGVPGWIPWALVLSSWRASALDEPAPPPRPPPSAEELAGARARPIAGIWRANSDQRTGWIEPWRGDEPELGHALLFEPALWRPASGTPVAVLPGSEVQPWPRGPVAAPSSRPRTFAAVTRVEADELVRLGPPPGDPLRGLERWAGRLRARLGQRVARLEGESSAGLLRALLTGERAGLSPEKNDLFARTGTSHLLAISGWHVGFFGALVLWPLSRAVGPRSRWRAGSLAARALLLAFFAAVAGAGKPVLRASLALAFAQLAVLGRGGPSARRPDGVSFLSAAFALECLIDPAGVASLSLSLSYAATLGLLIGTGPLLALFEESSEPELAPSLASRTARILARRARRSLALALCASLAAVLSTLPITWTVFGEFAPAGALITVLALPPFTALCLISWLGALVPAPFLGPPAELCARVLYGCLELADTLPGTPLPLPPRPALALAVATLLTFAALRRPGLRRLACLAWALLLLPWSAAPSGLELWALDVGHGTAVVCRAPGLEALVFDIGSRDRRGVHGLALAPLLASWEVARPIVVLSHADQDHASGIPRLRERYDLGCFFGPAPAQLAVREPHGPRGRWPARRDSRRERPERGFDPGPGRMELPNACEELTLTFLRGSEAEGNEGSRALEIRWRQERILLLGDAEVEGLASLELGRGPLRLLLAPHHGSEAPGLWPKVELAPPAEVWVSATRSPAIGPELDRRGIPWRWTARDGPLALCLP